MGANNNGQDLSNYIQCVASKKLRDVEIDKLVSNQHELNGVAQLKRILGNDSNAKIRFPSTFAYLADEEDECFTRSGNLTWYDARHDNPKRSEFRLYYDNDDIFSAARPGDDLYIIKRTDGTFATLVCRQGSEIDSQVKWLFDLREQGKKFDVKEIVGGEGLSYPAKFVLDLIGIETIAEDDDIQQLLTTYQDFPSTMEFSEYARGFVDIDPVNHPDSALTAWLDKENTFFKALEQHQIVEIVSELSKELEQGVPEQDIVVDFIKTSLRVQNRRKSRAGFSFENHLMALFDANGIRYSHEPVTEDGNTPDFIMPSIEMYHDPNSPTELLTMLAAKTSCKERWRQILKEANRIQYKHLITLEPAISANSLHQMRGSNVQLVAPETVRQTYTTDYREWVWNVETFITYVQDKQHSL